jgi:hypothetical protein
MLKSHKYTIDILWLFNVIVPLSKSVQVFDGKVGKDLEGAVMACSKVYNPEVCWGTLNETMITFS